MNTSAFKSTSQLKSMAREALLGNLGRVVGATLLYLVIYLVVLNLVTPVGDSLFFLITLHLSSFVVSLLSGLFDSGFAYMFLQIIYGDETRVSDLFHGFKESQNKAILIKLVFVILALISSIPLFIYEFSHEDSLSPTAYIIATIFAYILEFILLMPFSQAFYLLQDFPAQSVKALLSGSIRLMRGQYFRYVKLTLSFLPLALLGVITLFIPLLFTNAYYNTARAVFYKELMDEGARKKETFGTSNDEY